MKPTLFYILIGYALGISIHIHQWKSIEKNYEIGACDPIN